MARYFDQLYFEGYSSHHGEKVAAEVMFAIPEVSKHGQAALVCSRRALRRWARLMPSRQRLPLPSPCLMPMVGSACAEGKGRHALTITIDFVCHLRPGELDQLTTSQLIPPSPGAGARYQKWGELLHPSPEGRVGKTGLKTRLCWSTCARGSTRAWSSS